MTIASNFSTVRPSLLIDFAKSKTVDPRITFTRASIATYFDSFGVLQVAQNNIPRIDFDPSTLACQGLLIEESRINSIRNNTMQGAVAGTPGTNPTNWGTTPNPTLNGITRDVAGVGVEDGIAYVDYRISGTASAQVDFAIRFEALNQIAAASGQTWTLSFYSRLIAGSLSPLTASFFYLIGTNGTTQTEVASTITYNPTSASLKSQRFVGTGTFANALTTNAASTAILRVPNGATVDFTLRIGLPQLEQGAFATSVIPTTTAAVTRNADSASITGTNFSSWYNASAGTLVGEYLVQNSGTDRRLATITESAANYFGHRVTTVNGVNGIYRIGASNFDVINTGTFSTGTLKQVIAYATSDFASAYNGGAVGSTAPTSIAPVTLWIGQGPGTSTFANSYIRSIRYYPVRLSNTQLQALTAS